MLGEVALPPGPREPSFIQLLQFTQRPLPWLDACARRYGDPFTARFFGLGTFVLVSAPELIKQIFTGDPDQLHAGEANAILAPVLGKSSVLLLDGPPHLRQRRLLSPPLRGERMFAYADLIAGITTDAIARMPRGEPFALHPVMQSITLDVILRAVFGLTQGARMAELRALLVEMLEPPPAIVAFLPPKYLDFPFSPYRTFMTRLRAVDRKLYAILRARMASATASPTTNPTTNPTTIAESPGDDILSLLLAARDDQGVPMTIEELRDELITMLIAGHETTATALSWTFACLLEHPDIGARLSAELERAMVPDGRGEHALDPEALNSLDYLDAVIKETLRLRPILPDVVRKLQSPIDFAGFRIPAGVSLTPCIHLAHRRPDSYPDPLAFRPERWLGARVDPYAWLPFGGGIRRCLGMAFALYEMKIVVGTMWSRLRMRLARPGPVRVVRRTLTLAPEGGTRVILEPRHRAAA
jgi:cytochrome P450